ncbi:MAG: biotin--[acetyl-CoA-carboxylase] ligase, partial [Sphingopyxis sp.]
MIEFVAETGSTNSDLAQRVANGETGLERRWLVARRQTSGRGRLGRQWDSPPGNFHGSTVVDLRADDHAAHSLALVAAIAVADAIAATSAGAVTPTIKWPNDLLIGAAKLSGILLERNGPAVIVGVGANLEWAPQLAGRLTICMADLLPKGAPPVDVDRFAAALADCWAVHLAHWRAAPLASTVQHWLARAHPVGTALTISEGE